MRLRNVQRRVVQLESALAHMKPSSTDGEHHDLPTLVRELSTLTQDAVQIEKRAVLRGDDDTALSAMREICRIVELSARLSGEIEDKSTTNVLNVNMDSETATRILKIYEKRHTNTERETI
jgi:hypothetical protein